MRRILFFFCFGAVHAKEQKLYKENLVFFGGGSIACLYTVSNIDMGCNIQCGYNSFFGLDLGLGAIFKINGEWGSITGIRLSGIIDLGLKGKALSNSSHRVEDSYFKGIQGILFLDIETFSFGVYIDWSNKSILSKKGCAIGGVLASRYKLDVQYIELSGVINLGFVNRQAKHDVYSEFVNSGDKSIRLACYRAKAVCDGLSAEELTDFISLKDSQS